MRFTLNESERNSIRDLYIKKGVINEQSDQSKKLYISWANKKSGNPEMAMSIMDDVLKLQKSLPKRDFAKYSSYDELKNDLDGIISKQKEKDAVKIYEDKDLLVIQANTWEASCKYGAGTTWCTAGKDTTSNWNRYNRTGTEFIWIFKNKPMNDPQYKYSYHVKNNGSDDWCDALNDCVLSTNLSNKSYPKSHPKFDEIIEKLKSISVSRKGNVTFIDYRPLIENWLDNNLVELENISEKYMNIETILNDNWYEILGNIRPRDYGDGEFDDYDVEWAIERVEQDGPPEGKFQFDSSEYTFYYDIEDALILYMRNNNIPLSNENAERTLQVLTPKDVYDYSNFYNIHEQITEDIRIFASEDINQKIEDELALL
jgi:hypothetical protein